MENDNIVERSEFETFKDVGINVDVISDIMKDLVPIRDKKLFYIKCVMERVKKCDDLYLRELDEELDKVYGMLDRNEFSFNDFGRLLKLSSRMTSELHSILLDNLERICEV